MKCVLFVRTECFQNTLCLLSDFDMSGEIIQFHNIEHVGHVGEQFYNFIYFLIMNVF